jgi:hypothetical protein
MFRQGSIYKEARKNWVLLVNIHIAMIFISGILYFVLSDERSGFLGCIAVITSVSLLILVATYKLYPHWYRNKNNSIED